MSDNVNWSIEMTRKFLVLLSERAKTSHGTSIKSIDYQNMLGDLSSLAGKRLNVTHLSSKFFCLKKVYQAWCKLFQHTTFGWDHESQTPTHSLEVWEEYTKVQ